MTLIGVMAVILRYSAFQPNSVALGITSKWLKLDQYCVQQQCSPDNLSLYFGSI